MKASEVWRDGELCDNECPYYREEKQETNTGYLPRVERWCIKNEDGEDCPFVPEYDDNFDDDENND